MSYFFYSTNTTRKKRENVFDRANAFMTLYCCQSRYIFKLCGLLAIYIRAGLLQEMAKKGSRPVTSLQNRGPQKDLNDSN